jgi:hypothetical protein
MLEKLLNIIQNGGSFEVQALANQLDTTPGLIHLMLMQLEQMGKVKSNPTCENNCSQCGLRSSCDLINNSKREFNTWVLIDTTP